MLSTLLHCISDFERITDHALNVMQIAGEMNGKEQNFSAKAQEELRVFSDAVTDIIDRAVEAFKNYDLKMAKTIEPLEEVIDGINMEIKRRHVRRLRKGKCTIELGFSLTDITTNYERIADHCSNIAVCLLQVNEDGFDTHEYLERVWNKDDEEFRKMAEDYALPPEAATLNSLVCVLLVTLSLNIQSSQSPGVTLVTQEGTFTPS